MKTLYLYLVAYDHSARNVLGGITYLFSVFNFGHQQLYNTEDSGSCLDRSSRTSISKVPSKIKSRSLSVFIVVVIRKKMLQTSESLCWQVTR